MKKFWRCFVCNDIHYGVKPPELCPTCKVVDAYVEVSAAEAKRMMRMSAEGETPFSRERFREAIEALTKGNEFQVNPDQEKVSTLLDGVQANEARHGLRYCPCRLITKDFNEDSKLVCPCNFLAHETYKGLKNGECWCGLFVRRT